MQRIRQTMAFKHGGVVSWERFMHYCPCDGKPSMGHQFCITGLFVGNSQITGGFSSQVTSNADLSWVLCCWLRHVSFQWRFGRCCPLAWFDRIVKSPRTLSCIHFTKLIPENLGYDAQNAWNKSSNQSHLWAPSNGPTTHPSSPSHNSNVPSQRCTPWVFPGIRPKLILNSNLVKSRLPITHSDMPNTMYWHCMFKDKSFH